MRRFALASVPAAILIVLFGASLAAGASGEVVVAMGVDVLTLDPNIDTIIARQQPAMNMFDRLVALTAEMRPVPELAVAWEQPEPQRIRFRLRRGVKFHDGTEFTSKDVKFTYDRILDPALKSRLRDWIRFVAEVETPDPYTAVVRLHYPFAPALNHLAQIPIVSKDVVERVGVERFAKSPVGTGPFRFVEWVKDQRVVLEANPGYWKGAPKIQRIVWKPVPEHASRLAELLTGRADIVVNVPPQQVGVIERDPKLRVAKVRSLRTAFIAINTWQKPFDDVRVRQALNYGVDGEALIRDLFLGYGYRSSQPASPLVFGYNAEVKAYPYDPDRARKLLAEAGYPQGFKTTLDGPIARYPLDKEIVEAVAGQLRKIGVEVTPNAMEFNRFWERFLGKKFDGLGFLSVGNIVADPDWNIAIHMDSKRRGIYYNTPQLDHWIEEGKVTTDGAKREAIYQRIFRHVHEQAPWIFLLDYADLYGVSARLQWTPRADEWILLHEAVLRN
jgi:peptide/nickel transport system substrate-binding protein